jgi:hypothetical protein
MAEQPRRGFPKRIVVVLVVIVLAVAGYALLYRFTTGATGGIGGTINPCAEVSESSSSYGFVECHGIVVTERGASCNLSSGTCAMTLINNGSARDFELFTASCTMGLVSGINGTGANETVHYAFIDGVNGGAAALGVKPGATSTATCAFPTNRFMTNQTFDQTYMNGCFGVSQVGNESNDVSLCWEYGKWSATPVAVEPLDCPSLTSRITVSPNGTLRAIIYNGNSFDVWVTNFNGSSTVGPNGYAVYGSYSGEISAIATHYIVPAGSSTFFFLPGTLNPSQTAPYTLSFLPTNETITYTAPCEMEYTGTTTVGPG